MAQQDANNRLPISHLYAPGPGQFKFPLSTDAEKYHTNSNRSSDGLPQMSDLFIKSTKNLYELRSNSLKSYCSLKSQFSFHFQTRHNVTFILRNTCEDDKTPAI